MEFEALITERFSVRKFTQEHLEQQVIDKMLEAAHKAPTGCNNQPQRILVLNTDQSIQKLRCCTRSHFGAPTAMLVCHNREESWKRKCDGALSSPVDGVIVATYLMLAAQDLGVGCCWVMNFDPAAARTVFSIPDNVEPVALLVMGYPAADAEALPMHFESRPMDEVVRNDSF